MWHQKRGIVAKINGNTCIVLTPEGTFTKIRRPSSETRVGEELAYRSDLLSAATKPILLVAGLLVAFLIYPALYHLLVPQAVAYVSLDIHHGVEMAVDENNKVIGVRSFNDGGSVLADQLNLKGRDLNDAVAALVDKAIDLDYIGAGRNNLVVSTIVTPDSAPRTQTIDQNRLHEVLEESILRHGYSGQVRIYAASEELRLAAEKQKLTAGQYLVYEELVAAGHKLAIEDINGQSLGQLTAAYNMDGVSPQYIDNGSSGEVSLAEEGRTGSNVSRGYSSHMVRNVRVPGNQVMPATQAALAETNVRG